MKRTTAAVAIAVAITVTAPAIAAHATGIIIGASGVHTYNKPVCGRHAFVPIDLGSGNYANVFTSQSGNDCIVAEQHHDAWGVTSVSRNLPWQMPHITWGSFYGTYTCYDGPSAYPSSPGSKCLRFPVRQRYDGMPLTSVSYWPGNLAEGNVAYDIWFNRTYVAPAHTGQDNGTEIMIWLDHPGVGIWNVVRTATIARRRWYVMAWTMSRPSGIRWHYVAYVAVHPTLSAYGLWLNQFFREAEAHGELSANWWLTSINFGTEHSIGGKGFFVRNISLSGVR